MPLEDKKNKTEDRLASVRKELGEVNAARARRDANDKKREREQTEEKIADLVDRQVETHSDLEAAEALLDELEDGSDEELAVYAEIDLLERELDRRQPRIAKLRDRDDKRTAQYRKLDEVADKREARREQLKDRKVALKKKLAAIKKEIEENKSGQWPDDVTFTELMYHAPGPHIHAATTQRDKLIQIGKIAESLGIRVGEFPPFDYTEPVHTSGSWHYRDPSRPWVGIAYSSSHMQEGGDWGLAVDLNDLDGGSDKEVAFYHELSVRY